MGKLSMETIHKALSVIIYIPLTLLGLFAANKLYKFIYPKGLGSQGEIQIDAKIRRKSHNLTEQFMKTIIPWLAWLGIGMVDGKDFTQKYSFKLLAVFLLFLYFFLSYYLTYAYESNATLEKYSSTTNIILMLLGIFFSVYVSSLFMTSEPKGLETEMQPKDYPADKSMAKKAKWAWSESVHMYKYILGAAIALGISLLVLYIISKFTFLSLSVTVIIQIMAIIGLMFGIFLYVSKQPGWMAKIKKTPIFNVLYHFIFVIPCSLIYLTDSLYWQIKDTPQMVYFILLTELLVVGLYFFIPWLVRYLYTYSAKKNEVTLGQARTSNEMSMIHTTDEMNKIIEGLNIDWKMTVRKDLYVKENEPALKEYLAELGYEDTEAPLNESGEDGLFDWMFNRMSLTEAVAYVQVKTPLLIEEYNAVRTLEDTERQLNRMDEKQSEMYKAAVLLDQPVYTSEKKIIGSYEGLGGDIGVYNYNYGISSWFFIHEQPPGARAANSKFTSILNYGNKPNILFNVDEHMLQVKMNSGIDKETVIFETTDFPLQRWNNIVINYNGGTLDIFINNKLVSSSPNIVPYMAYDAITVGAADGISGGVCNVAYFPAPLSLERIGIFYNALESKNPPVI